MNNFPTRPPINLISFATQSPLKLLSHHTNFITNRFKLREKYPFNQGLQGATWKESSITRPPDQLFTSLFLHHKALKQPFQTILISSLLGQIWQRNSRGNEGPHEATWGHMERLACISATSEPNWMRLVPLESCDLALHYGAKKCWGHSGNSLLLPG